MCTSFALAREPMTKTTSLPAIVNFVIIPPCLFSAVELYFSAPRNVRVPSTNERNDFV